MRLETILPLDDPRATLEAVGGKGASLAKLACAGLPVPGGFHVTTAAYRRFVAENNLEPHILTALEGVSVAEPATLEAASGAIRRMFLQAGIPGEIASAIVSAYAALPGSDPAVAVRSSATAEDLPEASFAGQQETYLNISGADAVLEAARECWASLWTGRAIGYRLKQGVRAEGVALAVVVQLLAPAEAAGILFTANPLNGRRDQVVINAAWGLGEAVVGGAVTPDTLTVDKASRQVLERQTASKQVMTVRVDGATEEQPVPDSLQNVPVLDDALAADLTRLAVQIEDLYGMPMDIEWAWVDGKFAILQARPVTALPEPAIEVPNEWPMPNPKGQYMRTSIIDLMPDPLSPLFASMGMDAIGRGMDVMGADLFNLPADTLSGLLLTINGYGYYSASFSGRQWWLLLTRIGLAIPRMFREGVPYWREVALPQYKAVAKRWSQQPLQDLPVSELLKGIQEVMGASSHHLASLMVSTMGPSAGSEMLFTRVYEKMARRAGDPEAPAFLMGFDSLPIQGEKALYDLGEWCRESQPLRAYLLETPAEQIVAAWKQASAPAGVPGDAWETWRERFAEYLKAYGYSIYDLDFARPLPMDEPTPILEVLKLFIAGGGVSPHDRQRETIRRRELAEQAVRQRLRGFRRWAFEKSLKWAQKQAPLREEGIAEVGLGYPALRRLLSELGRRFADSGAIQNAEDIYWLEGGEVEAWVAALERGEALASKVEAVEQRKALWRGRKRLTPPPQLPPGKKYMGFDAEIFLASSAGGAEEGRIKGVPTSPGVVTAPACVLHGPQDFDQMKPGDILVAGITTPAWTPLFALAAGVVTDVGGPLSHGSIVAREYGIPAVMGTGMATRVIRSGQTITVDGGTGVVILDQGR